MKFDHPHLVLWDEMDTSRREDFPLQSPSESTSQVPVRTKGNIHLVSILCQTAMSTRLPEEVVLLILLQLFFLD
jgi:hypothetical protein